MIFFLTINQKSNTSGCQAGVRYSVENPYTYVQSNVVGFLNILSVAKIIILNIWYMQVVVRIWREY